MGHENEDNQSLYGVDNLYGEPDLFSEISGTLKRATERDTYHPFFEMQQQAAETSMLDAMNKGGSTFAGSGADKSKMAQLQASMGQTMVGVESDITAKMTDAESAIQNIKQGNMATSLALKKLAQDDPYHTDEHGNRTTDTGLFSNWWGEDKKDSMCVVSTTLNAEGEWSDMQRLKAVNWCRETHHDGSLRGKTWIKGYHTWGKFLSKWMKRSKLVKLIVKETTNSFMNKDKDWLGSVIHYGWINPLSYAIGFSKRNKVLGYVVCGIMGALYTVLFPLFGLMILPRLIRRKYGNIS